MNIFDCNLPRYPSRSLFASAATNPVTIVTDGISRENRCRNQWVPALWLRRTCVITPIVSKLDQKKNYCKQFILSKSGYQFVKLIFMASGDTKECTLLTVQPDLLPSLSTHWGLLTVNVKIRSVHLRTVYLYLSTGVDKFASY